MRNGKWAVIGKDEPAVAFYKLRYPAGWLPSDSRNVVRMLEVGAGVGLSASIAMQERLWGAMRAL